PSTRNHPPFRVCGEEVRRGVEEGAMPFRGNVDDVVPPAILGSGLMKIDELRLQELFDQYGGFVQSVLVELAEDSAYCYSLLPNANQEERTMAKEKIGLEEAVRLTLVERGDILAPELVTLL